MKKSVSLLSNGFESSSGVTPEFKHFSGVFRKELKKELESIGATDIKFSVGHFYISGFFTVNKQAYYFRTPDVRDFAYGAALHPFSSANKLLYRTAKDYKDYTGGSNQYVSIREEMAQEMYLKK